MCSVLVAPCDRTGDRVWDTGCVSAVVSRVSNRLYSLYFNVVQPPGRHRWQVVRDGHRRREVRHNATRWNGLRFPVRDRALRVGRLYLGGDQEDSIHSFTVKSHSGPRRSIILSLLPSDQHALPSRSVAGLPVLLRIGCDAQLACASRLSRFTLLGNDPTLRGLHPCISHRYLTVPFRGARRTDTVTGGPSRGMQR